MMIYLFIFNLFFMSSCYPPPGLPSSHSSSKRMPPPHIHLPPTPVGLPIPWGLSLSRVRWGLYHWDQTRQSSDVYVSGASYQVVYAAWLVAQCLRDVRGPSSWDYWPFYGVALLLSFFQPFPNSDTVVLNFRPLVGCKYLLLSQAAAYWASQRAAMLDSCL